MVADPATSPATGTVSTDELKRLIRAEAGKTMTEVLLLKVGLAGVFATIVPGLGHVLLRSYAWAVVYIAGYAAAWYGYIYQTTRPLGLWEGHTPSKLWILVMVIWLINIIHAVRLAHNQED